MAFKLVTPPEGQTAPQKRFRLVAPPDEPSPVNAGAKSDIGEFSGGATAKDMLNSAAWTAKNVVTSTLGLPGDMAELAGQGVGKVAGWMGASPETSEYLASTGKQITSNVLNPLGAFVPQIGPRTSGEINEVLKGVIGPDQRALTPAGRGTESVTSMALGAVAPGGPVRKAAQVLAPGLAHFAAGELTEGTAAQPYAKIGAALTGGMVAAGRGGTVGREAARHAPSHEQVRNTTNAMYDDLRNSGIGYDQQGFQQMAVGLMQNLTRDGFRRAQAPLSADALDAIGEQIQAGTLDFNDLDSIRKTTSAIFRNQAASPTDREAAERIIDALDDFGTNGITHTNGLIDPAHVPQMVRQAREMARRNILARQIEDMQARAETYQSGEQSGLRNQFSNYLRSNKARGLSAEEREAFMEVAHGGRGLERLGRFGLDFSRLGSPSMFFPTVAGGASYAGGEPVLGAALVAGGTAAKYASRAKTRQNVNRALATALVGREGQQAARHTVADRRRQSLIRALISGQGSLAPLHD